MFKYILTKINIWIFFLFLVDFFLIKVILKILYIIMLRAKSDISKIIPRFLAHSFNSYEPIDFKFRTSLMLSLIHI